MTIFQNITVLSNGITTVILNTSNIRSVWKRILTIETLYFNKYLCYFLEVSSGQ